MSSNLEEAKAKLRNNFPSVEELAKNHEIYRKRPDHQKYYPFLPMERYYTEIQALAKNNINNIDDAMLYAKYLYMLVYEKPDNDQGFGNEYRKHLEQLLSSSHNIDKAPIAFLLAQNLLETSQRIAHDQEEVSIALRDRGKQLMQQLVSNKDFGSTAKKALGVSASHYDENMYAEEFIKNVIKLLEMGKSKDRDMGAAKKIEPILKKYNIDINTEHEFQPKADYLGAVKELQAALKHKAGGVSDLLRRSESSKLYEAISKIDLNHPSRKGGIETMAFHIVDKPTHGQKHEQKHGGHPPTKPPPRAFR